MRINNRLPNGGVCHYAGGGGFAAQGLNIFELKKEFLSRVNRPPRVEEFSKPFLYQMAADLYAGGKKGLAAMGTVLQMSFWFSAHQEATRFDKTICMLDNTVGKSPAHLAVFNQDGLPTSMEFQKQLLYTGIQFKHLPKELEADYAQQTYMREPGKIYVSSANVAYYCYVLEKGLSLQAENKLDEALLWFKAAILLNPDIQYAYVFLAEIYKIKKDYSSQGDIWLQLIELYPDQPTLYVERGLSLQSLGVDDLALEYYDKAIKLDPKFFPAILAKGALIRQTGDLEGSLPNFEDIINNGPSNETKAIAYAEIGAVLLSLKRVDEAIGYLEQGSSEFPAFAAIFKNLAIAYTVYENYAAALSNIERYLELEPKDTAFISLKASFLLQLGRKNEAIEFAREQLFNPETPDEIVMAFINSLTDGEEAKQ